MMNQFIIKRNNLSLKFATAVAPKTEFEKKNMLNQIMGIRSHSNEKYVITAAHINLF